MTIKNNIFYFEQLQKRQLLFVLICLFMSIGLVTAQEEKELKEAQKLLSEASLELKNDNFPSAEADYRQAIALNPKNETGKYNLGTAYYDKNMNATAMNRFKQAAAVSNSKDKKHKAFHNLGNTYMNDKKYQEAVDAYKNALRNSPTDDETRYNYALAKKMLEDQQKDGGDDGDDKEKNEDNKDEKDKKDQDQKDKNEEDKKDGDEGDEGDKDEEKDKGDKKDEEKEGDKKDDQGKPDKPKDQKEEKQQPVPGKMSPQQIKNLLQAMNNEEKKVQEKINAKKQKGAKVKSEKDW